MQRFYRLAPRVGIRYDLVFTRSATITHRGSTIDRIGFLVANVRCVIAGDVARRDSLSAYGGRRPVLRRWQRPYRPANGFLKPLDNRCGECRLVAHIAQSI
jgi:hypothetical protein